MEQKDEPTSSNGTQPLLQQPLSRALWTSPNPACRSVGWGLGIVFNSTTPELTQVAPSAESVDLAATDTLFAQFSGDVIHHDPDSRSNANEDGSGGVRCQYFEAQLPLSMNHDGIQATQDSMLVGFAPKGAMGVKEGVFFEASTWQVWFNGQVNPPSAKFRTQRQKWLEGQRRDPKDRAESQTDVAETTTVGAGVDANKRVFFTVNGALVCVPLEYKSESDIVDHHSVAKVPEARGGPIRVNSSRSAASVALVRGSGTNEPCVALFNVGDTPFMYTGTHESKQIRAGIQPPLSAEKVFVNVSRWLSCTGWSPLADRVIVPMGRFPNRCYCPGLHVSDDEPSLFRGLPCFADFAWSSIFADGPEGASAKKPRQVRFEDTYAQNGINRTIVGSR